MALGAEDEITANLDGQEVEWEREREREASGSDEGDSARETEPFRCFNPFA